MRFFSVLLLYVFVVLPSVSLFRLDHMCQSGGPRAKCGPPRLFMWSAKLKI